MAARGPYGGRRISVVLVQPINRRNKATRESGSIFYVCSGLSVLRSFVIHDSKLESLWVFFQWKVEPLGQLMF